MPTRRVPPVKQLLKTAIKPAMCLLLAPFNVLGATEKAPETLLW